MDSTNNDAIKGDKESIVLKTNQNNPSSDSYNRPIAQSVSVDDYESLPSDKLSHIMLAGASAGIMEHCIMFPFDTVKVCNSLFFI